VQIEKAPEREMVAKITSTNHDETIKKEPTQKETKTGRNDECSCGSGKKYKNCCGRG